MDVGHKFIFDAAESDIEDKITGEKMWLRDDGGCI